MGFSVSGTFALVAIGLLVAFGMFQTATANRLELVTDAVDAADDDRLDRLNTAINVTRATYDGGSNTLTVNVTNNGTTVLAVSETDVLVDNAYADPASTDVNGDTGVDQWLPGESLRVNVTWSSTPDRVRVVSGPGPADARGVS